MENLIFVVFLLVCGLLVFVMLAFPQLGPERNALALAYNDLRVGMSQEEALKTIKEYFSKKPCSSYSTSAYDEECESWRWKKQDGWSDGQALLEVEFNKSFNVQQVKYFYSFANKGVNMWQWTKSIERAKNFSLK